MGINTTPLNEVTQASLGGNKGTAHCLVPTPGPQGLNDFTQHLA